MRSFRVLTVDELTVELFNNFNRHQVVDRCYRKDLNGNWLIRSDPFIDDWSADEYAFLGQYLKNTLLTNGFVYGAFEGNELKGFVSVESEIFDDVQRYADMTSLHVSEELRGQGIGKALFMAAKEWAKQHGAKKLYISAHSAIETQAFYRALGCSDALSPHAKHVAAEPFDCQLECPL